MAKLLPVPFYKQNKPGYCLPACAQMVLSFQGVQLSQSNLAQQLKVKPALGTPTRNIQRLTTDTVSVVYEKSRSR